MPRKIRLHLKDLILLLLVPAVLLVTVVMGALIYDGLSDVIMTGFDRKLSAVSSVMGAFIDGDEHSRILRTRNERSAFYRRYVAPLRAIKAKTDLTFSYTQVLGQGRQIFYVMDAEEGDKHTPPGYQDEVPEVEVRGVRDVMQRGTIHLSAIRAWEQWGQLKSGFAPIYNRRGEVVAMAGADVDLSSIRKETGEALLRVGVTSVVALLIAGFLAISIARTLTAPIEAVKEAALQVAAGQFGHRIEVDRPRELADLAAAFNAMSRTLAETVTELTETNRSLERRRCHQELLRVLAHPTTPPPHHLPATLAHAWLGRRPHCSDTTGCALGPDGAQLLVWRGIAVPDPLEAVQRRSDITAVAARMLERWGDDWEALSSRLPGLFQDSVTCFALLDARSGRVQSLARRPTPVTVLSSAAEPRTVDLSGTPLLCLASDETLILASDERLAALLSAVARDARDRQCTGTPVPASRLLSRLQDEWERRCGSASASEEAQAGPPGLVAVLTGGEGSR